ncbi:hypothetical protein QFZ28_005857 [Neobacillus niacini]|uniref:hypothetical protein n=1 Tax=Neobacillus niacini TaxID=86668 RepID=UPI002780C1A8|nr:hypothetical protein [Neobacillus niacini]MDQ1005279.1 hypothetical protein [Neobacillus niacini]
MVEKIIVLVIVSLGILIYDVPKLKRTNRRERIVYGMLMIPIIYLSLIYLMDLGWPSLDELFHFFFLKPAQQIVEAIKIPK